MNFTDIMSLVESGTISFDDVKEYNENVHMISEAYTNGEITHDHKEELILENRRVYFGDLFEEKATRLEYTIRQFKKRYQYDPQKKTIIVNGETYNCDLDVNSKTIAVKDAVSGDIITTIRSTSSATGDPEKTIYLDKIFFELKNNKRRDAALQHEIGHLKLHSIDTNFDIWLDDQVEETVNSMKQQGFRKVNKDKVRSEIIDDLKKNGITRDTFKNTTDEKMKNLRATIRADLEKKFLGNINGDNDHTSTSEFEADRYAVNKTSAGQTKKMIREGYKKINSLKNINRMIDGENQAMQKELGMTKSEFNKSRYKIHKTKEEIDEIQKSLKKKSNEDSRLRIKSINKSGIEKDPEKNKLYQ